jgi:hypothetical protein
MTLTLAAHPYRYVSTAAAGTGRLSGFLGVLPPCTNPVTSSVSASITLGQITLSQTTIPCGTVTFTVTNTDMANVHDLNFALPTLPRGVAFGPHLRPGQSATMVVNFPYKGTVYYFCSQTEHDENGESGDLTVH